MLGCINDDLHIVEGTVALVRVDESDIDVSPAGWDVFRHSPQIHLLDTVQSQHFFLKERVLALHDPPFRADRIFRTVGKNLSGAAVIALYPADVGQPEDILGVADERSLVSLGLFVIARALRTAELITLLFLLLLLYLGITLLRWAWKFTII